MIHIISQINVDPRRLRSPFTYCHNALRCTKKLTRNHQFRLPHCGARCRPTYISTSTNLHINADQLTYQHVNTVQIITGGQRITVLLKLQTVKLQQCYIQSCDVARWNSYQWALSYPWQTWLLSYNCHKQTMCSNKAVYLNPISSLSSWVLAGLVSCPFFMSFCFNVPYQLTLLHNLRPLTSQVNAMLPTALCFANLSFLIGIGYHSWFTPTFTGMQLRCKRKVGCSLKCTEIVDGVQLV